MNLYREKNCEEKMKEEVIWAMCMGKVLSTTIIGCYAKILVGQRQLRLPGKNQWKCLFYEGTEHAKS